MLNKCIFLAILALGGLAQTPTLLAQDAPAGQQQPEAPRVFFDCQGPGCGGNNETYYRTEIPWVTWVRDQQDADLHVIMTSQNTGAQGREYQIDATGRDAFADYEDQTFYRSLGTDTQRETLDGRSQALAIAFARFAQYAGFRDLVTVQAAQRGTTVRQANLVSSDQVNDPWNLWVFRVGGNGNFQGEETRTTRRLSGNLNISRVTPTWKQNYSMFVNYNFQRTKFPNRPKFVDERTDWNFNSTVVYSVAQYWSIGFTSRVARSVRNNQNLALEFSPALEYSVFPYDEATRRSLTAFYEIGPAYFDYFELTQDEVLEETRFKQSLSLEFSQRQTWGDASISIRGSHYLHDFDRNNLDMSGRVSFRVFRGLDVNFSGNFTLVADQLYLPFEDLTDDELLTGVRSARTDRRHSFSIGLSYQFGSIFNNIVNNRFPGGGGGFGGGGGGGRGGGPGGFGF